MTKKIKPQDIFDEIVKIRRDIHQHPETGFDVVRTATLAAEELKRCGIKVCYDPIENGVIGDITVPGATRRIALRADMDALPMQEEGMPPYRSLVDGKAHMCGHDVHTAMLIGAARILSSRATDLKVNVRFLFQPSEEILPGGAPGMIRNGALEGVDEIYALHVWPALDTGMIGICKGQTMAQADTFDIIIKGRGGHAAAAHLTIDPIVIGSQVVTAFQSIVSRSVNALDSAVVSVTQFHAGSADNVIPSTAHLNGTVRTYSKEVNRTVRQQMEAILSGICNAFGANYELHYHEGYPPLINHEKACERAMSAALTFSQEKQVLYPATCALFGEDFAYYCEKVPGCFIQLGCRNESIDCSYPLHHSKFNADEQCIAIGMNLLTSIVLEQY